VTEGVPLALFKVCAAWPAELPAPTTTTSRPCAARASAAGLHGGGQLVDGPAQTSAGAAGAAAQRAAGVGQHRLGVAG
jgi:hypothetical protein